MKIVILYWYEKRIWKRTKILSISNNEPVDFQCRRSLHIHNLKELGFFLDANYFVTDDFEIESQKLFEIEKELEPLILLWLNQKVKKPFILLGSNAVEQSDSGN